MSAMSQIIVNIEDHNVWPPFGQHWNNRRGMGNRRGAWFEYYLLFLVVLDVNMGFFGSITITIIVSNPWVLIRAVKASCHVSS